MIQKIRDTVEGDGRLAASCRPLNDENPILRISDNGILLLLDRADDILKLHVAVSSKLGL